MNRLWSKNGKGGKKGSWEFICWGKYFKALQRKRRMLKTTREGLGKLQKQEGQNRLIDANMGKKIGRGGEKKRQTIKSCKEGTHITIWWGGGKLLLCPADTGKRGGRLKTK